LPFNDGTANLSAALQKLLVLMYSSLLQCNVPSLNGNDCAPNIYTQNSNESKNRTYKYGITFIIYRYLNFVYVDIRCGQHNHDR
jgi:hypothetical protein